MGLKDFFFEKSDKTDEEPKKEKPAPGSGQTSFSRRLPDISTIQDKKSIDMDMSFVPATKPTNNSGLDDGKLHAHFDQVLAESGGAGPNYFAFSQMLGEMGELPDGPKYKGAFAALRSQGLSKQNLVDSANTFLQLLDRDNEGFKSEALGTQKESRDQIQAVNNLVDLNNQSIAKVTQDTALQIKQLEEARDIKIRQLQKEIDDNKKKIAPLEEEASKINDRIASFDRACSNYKSMIVTDIQKIQTIIPG